MQIIKISSYKKKKKKITITTTIIIVMIIITYIVTIKKLIIIYDHMSATYILLWDPFPDISPRIAAPDFADFYCRYWDFPRSGKFG